ncbi:MAG: oligopeptidase B [Actinobacteria bacterium 13_1_20CM_2_65_11]|nr:MAG: oligopeptidase B [Chloroflexi bacterium 13_1_40CM_65_17]OLC65171.1 MAG: oligopeptidase B [Actinobacteria bacterium 13_1_40CM_4_65_12]OLD51047.1 MAG: oligopeptidase B [Actinobacteria bacterium 13_1_40CM_2_65_8]OLE80365.1 MAG: oligopeptidase B [Actinobacteria bacterium 13_1_20CM_2_65_11]
MEEPVGASRPPIPAQYPTVLTKHGDSRVDPYFWLRQRANPEVIAYLEAENEYTDAVMAPVAKLQERLYQEIVDRIEQTDVSPASFFKGYWHYTRTVEGLDYEIHCRRKGSMDAPEEVELDANLLAQGHDYFELGFVEHSQDGSVLAYAVDLTGSELHEVRFRDLSSGQELPDVLDGVYYGSAWSADGRTFFYVRPDKTMRPYQVWRHALGTPVDQDVLVLQEDDERFELGVELTKSERYIIFTSSSQITSESRYLRSDDPAGEPVLIEGRRHGVEYSVDHQGDRFLILTNDGARNFSLMAAPVDRPGREGWTELVPERAGVRLNATDVHVNHVVLGQRSDGLQRLEVLDSTSGELHIVDQPDAAYTAYAGSNPVYDSTVMRFFYTSLNAPWSAFDYDMNTRERTLVKEQPVRGGYNRADYVTDRLWATSADGVQVPLSIVYRRGLTKNGANPTLLYGYGAYEMPSDPMFDAARLGLLDRGFVYAIAHVRGGGELGREWYEDGKFLEKTNTFDDFIACAGELIEQRYTNPRRLAIRGRSAGGLLIGAVLNARPDLFACAVAQVPFVDALTTMLDESIPLTVNEYEEWGDPNDPEFYEYMKTYSPYDNVHRTTYPAVLATAGFNDPRVPYWEPAKWVAKLRSATLSARPILLKTDLGSGHSGPSGRYESWREEAFVSAFVVDQLQAS